MVEPTATGAGIIASLFTGNEGMARVSFASMGLVGSVLSMQFIDHMSKRQRLVAVITSIFLADIGAQPLADMVGASKHAFGAAGMIGLFGFSLCGAFIKGIKQFDISSILNSWLSRRS